MPEVKRGPSRQRSQTTATRNAGAAGVATAERADVPAPQRVVVNKVLGKRPDREYAPQVFDSSRNRDVETAAADVREAAEDVVDAVERVVAADTATGGPMVMESDTVIGGGAAASRTRPRPAPPRAPSTGSRGQWMGATDRPRDEVLPNPTGDAVDPEAVRSEEQIARPRQAGAPDPTGAPCTCAYEWEVDEATGDITVFSIDGIPTGFRGAPRYMTWCIVCGGERDGNFRPDNAVRYGGALPEVEPVPSADEIARKVMARMAPVAEVDEDAIAARVTATVTEQVGGMLMSDAFITALTQKLADRRETDKPKF